MIPQDFLPVFPMPESQNKKKQAPGFSSNTAKSGKRRSKGTRPKPLPRAIRERPKDSRGNAIYWHGKTLGEVSRASGIALSTVSRVYNRIRRPTLDVAICLSSALGITIDALLHELFADSKGRLVHLPKHLAPVDDAAVPTDKG